MHFNWGFLNHLACLYLPIFLSLSLSLRSLLAARFKLLLLLLRFCFFDCFDTNKSRALHKRPVTASNFVALLLHSRCRCFWKTRTPGRRGQTLKLFRLLCSSIFLASTELKRRTHRLLYGVLVVDSFYIGNAFFNHFVFTARCLLRVGNTKAVLPSPRCLEPEGPDKFVAPGSLASPEL